MQRKNLREHFRSFRCAAGSVALRPKRWMNLQLWLVPLHSALVQHSCAVEQGGGYGIHMDKRSRLYHEHLKPNSRPVIPKRRVVPEPSAHISLSTSSPNLRAGTENVFQKKQTMEGEWLPRSPTTVLHPRSGAPNARINARISHPSCGSVCGECLVCFGREG